jgi:hypothetical protein
MPRSSTVRQSLQWTLARNITASRGNAMPLISKVAGNAGNGECANEVRATMSEDPAAEYVELSKRYRDLAEGVRMIRRAVAKAFHAGVLPSMEPIGITPLQECEAIARAIYAVAVKHNDHTAAAKLAGLHPDDFSTSHGRGPW